MEVVIISKGKYEEMVGKLNLLSDRVNEIIGKREKGKLSRWMDNQEVCQQLRISPRTLQTLRDHGTLAYSQIGHNMFYKPEDVQSIVRLVEDRRKDAGLLYTSLTNKLLILIVSLKFFSYILSFEN